ncbi:MAG: hypothetical protein ACJAZ2_000926, partial [Glaciecola sp.]
MKRSIAVILSMFVINSCAIFHKTSDDNQKLDPVSSNTDTITKVDLKDFVLSELQLQTNHLKSLTKSMDSSISQEFILTGLMDNSPTPLASPYPEFSNIRDSLQLDFESCFGIIKKVNGVLKELDEFHKGKTTIVKTDKQWIFYERDKNEIDSLNSDYKNIKEKINQLCKNRASLIKEYKITTVNKEELLQVLSDGSKQIDVIYSHVIHLHSGLIIESQQKLLKDQKKKGEFKVLLTEILTDAETLKDVQLKITKLTDQIIKEFGGQANKWSGPGMAS